MFTKFGLIILSVFLSVALTGCGAKTSTPASSNAGENGSQSGPSSTATESNNEDNYLMLPLITGNEANISLDATADGTTQQLKQGEVLSITLESNPSTGYGWVATISDPAIMVQMGEPVYQEPPSNSSTPALGASGTQTFYFQALETGATTLRLDYKRSFETNVAPEKTVRVAVEVK